MQPPEIKEIEKLDEMRGEQGFGTTGRSTQLENETNGQKEKDIHITMVGETNKGDEIWMATLMKTKWTNSQVHKSGITNSRKNFNLNCSKCTT